MKTIRYFLPLVIVVLFIMESCNNASDNESTSKDTTAKKDTLRNNPDNFSEPH